MPTDRQTTEARVRELIDFGDVDGALAEVDAAVSAVEGA